MWIGQLHVVLSRILVLKGSITYKGNRYDAFNKGKTLLSYLATFANNAGRLELFGPLPGRNEPLVVEPMSLDFMVG